MIDSEQNTFGTGAGVTVARMIKSFGEYNNRVISENPPEKVYIVDFQFGSILPDQLHERAVS